jgi:hypothetical protein
LSRRVGGFAAATLVVAAAAPLIACGFDFDRFDPNDAGPDGSIDATSPASDEASADAAGSRDATSEQAPVGSGGDAGAGDAARGDAASGDAAAPDTASGDAPSRDAPADAPAPRDGGSPCSAPPSCFQQATSCGSTCGQSYQQCVVVCGGQLCRQNCLSTEQSCLGRCATTCIGCTQDAGCAASSQCLDASHT